MFTGCEPSGSKPLPRSLRILDFASRVLKRISIDERIAALIWGDVEIEAGRDDIERWAGKIVYNLLE